MSYEIEFYLRKLLNVQKNSKDTDMLYVHTYILPYLTFYLHMQHLPQLKNKYWYITVNESPQFIQISWIFFPNMLFLFQDLIQHTTLCLAIMSP